MITPQYLTSGSKIALVAPARCISMEEISFSIDFIRDKGYIPVYDERLFLSHNQFAGTDEQRAETLQYYLDDNNIDAILCVRGGYGTVRIIDKLDFKKFLEKPKWVAGYSDITVLHAKLQHLEVESLHSTMPINFPDNTPQALNSLFEALSGKINKNIIKATPINNNREMSCGEIVGGNISVLYSLLGSDIFPDTYNKILLLEDLDEYLYHIDRMMTAFERAGKLDKVKAIAVGALTKMHDNNIPFGMSAEEIIMEKAMKKNIPVYLNCPSGHINDNRTIILGRETEIF